MPDAGGFHMRAEHYFVFILLVAAALPSPDVTPDDSRHTPAQATIIRRTGQSASREKGRAVAAPVRKKPRAVRVLTATATAYCLRGRTASGRHAGPGVIAVDPRVIPLGSRVHVEGYGHAVAADTGGAIKGRRIDIWLPSRSGCYRWGRRTVRVTVYPKNKLHKTRKTP